MKDLLPTITTVTAFLCGVLYGILSERMADRKHWQAHRRYMAKEAPKPDPAPPSATDEAWIDEIEQMFVNRKDTE